MTWDQTTCNNTLQVPNEQLHNGTISTEEGQDEDDTELEERLG